MLYTQRENPALCISEKTRRGMKLYLSIRALKSWKEPLQSLTFTSTPQVSRSSLSSDWDLLGEKKELMYTDPQICSHLAEALERSISKSLSSRFSSFILRNLPCSWRSPWVPAHLCVPLAHCMYIFTPFSLWFGCLCVLVPCWIITGSIRDLFPALSRCLMNILKPISKAGSEIQADLVLLFFAFIASLPLQRLHLQKLGQPCVQEVCCPVFPTAFPLTSYFPCHVL